MPKEEVGPALQFLKEPSASLCGVSQHLCLCLEFPACVAFSISLQHFGPDFALDTVRSLFNFPVSGCFNDVSASCLHTNQQ